MRGTSPISERLFGATLLLDREVLSTGLPKTHIQTVQLDTTRPTDRSRRTVISFAALSVKWPWALETLELMRRSDVRHGFGGPRHETEGAKGRKRAGRLHVDTQEEDTRHPTNDNR